MKPTLATTMPALAGLRAGACAGAGAPDVPAPLRRQAAAHQPDLAALLNAAAEHDHQDDTP